MKKEMLQARADVVRAVRRFFDDRGFLEVHTPRLVGLPGQEPYLDPLWTVVGVPKLPASRFQLPVSLITSPEYSMKKLLGEGMDKIYDLGPCFRDNEPWDETHDVEFLLLEWYRRDAGVKDLMDDAEALVRFVSHQIPLLTKERLGEVSFRRLTVVDALEQYAHLDLEPLLENRAALADVCRTRGYTVTDDDTWDDLFFKIFLTEVEPKLGWSDSPPYEGVCPDEWKEGVQTSGRSLNGGLSEWQPTFLYQYPACMAALARRDPSDPRFAQRVELYIGDLELANGFAELSDPVEQRARFEADILLRKKLGKKTWDIDERFLSALPGMGNAAGMAFGVDRLAMLFAGASSIDDLMPIPIQKRISPSS